MLWRGPVTRLSGSFTFGDMDPSYFKSDPLLLECINCMSLANQKLRDCCIVCACDIKYNYFFYTWGACKYNISAMVSINNNISAFTQGLI